MIILEISNAQMCCPIKHTKQGNVHYLGLGMLHRRASLPINRGIGGNIHFNIHINKIKSEHST